MNTTGLCVIVTSMALGEKRVRFGLQLARFAADAGIPTTVICVDDAVRLCDREYAGTLVRYREAFRKSGGALFVDDLSVAENDLDFDDIIESAAVQNYKIVVETMKAGGQLLII